LLSTGWLNKAAAAANLVSHVFKLPPTQPTKQPRITNLSSFPAPSHLHKDPPKDGQVDGQVDGHAQSKHFKQFALLTTMASSNFLASASSPKGVVATLIVVVFATWITKIILQGIAVRRKMLKLKADGIVGEHLPVQCRGCQDELTF
jgi:hypothetical protein